MIDRSWYVFALLCSTCCSPLPAADHRSPDTYGARSVVNTSQSPHVRFRNVDLADVRWTEGFWAERFAMCRNRTVPALVRVMELPDNSANFNNLRVAAGMTDGEFVGNKWSDGDCYKLMEAMAALRAATGDPRWDGQLDEWIEVIERAQQPDGYIATQIQLTEIPRWKYFKNHELYNMGHLLTAACIHHRATGKDNFLNVARKLGDYLCTEFLPRPKALAHFGFNPSNIMGAVELYRTTGESRYLELAKTFVDMRGSQPGGSDQNQSKIPLRQEREAVGHAVTAGYLWCGAADVFAETGDEELLDALQRLWADVTERKMYITGGTAALHNGESERRILARDSHDSVHEAFGAPYQLPNGTAYNETCANIANAMWNWRMLMLTGDAKHAEVVERVLYNSMLSSIGIGGVDFFYTNPLCRITDQPLLKNDSTARWADTTPSSPLNCFCCPPNVARTLAELGGWAYGVNDDAVWVHLYGRNTLETVLPSGRLRLRQTTQYPWNGRVTIQIEEAPPQEFALLLRIPSWAEDTSIRVNGKPIDQQPRPSHYLELRRRWSAMDKVELDLPMDVRLIEAHPLVEENRNHVAVMRGPLVYCLESADLPKPTKLGQVRLPSTSTWNARYDSGLLGGITTLQTTAVAIAETKLKDKLYREWSPGSSRQIPLTLIPYYSWANRGVGEMTVWIPVAYRSE